MSPTENEIANRLKEDFASARDRLESDGFAERLIRGLAQRRRFRWAVFAVAGGLGAIAAGSQFGALANALAANSPLVRDAARVAEAAGYSTSFAPMIFAAFAVLFAVLATAFVLQAEQ